VYVIDDPALMESFIPQAEALYRLYGLPFRWVWGAVNRGFSGANNLGAAHSSAPKILFLNSDAFPRQPGWIQPLLEVLDADPTVGAVGPRLVFADGSIQHAGMEFLRREEFHIWVNHHPWRGLDTSLDPATGLTFLPAITGACLAMTRDNFERIGGWDTGYLIGDFEDSDLCLKLRDQGFKIAYLPTVELTHLERQSFRLLGEGHFRTSVVLFNAFRHQSRWSHLLGSD
jgi:GT2 family glycosyltransferase